MRKIRATEIEEVVREEESHYESYLTATIPEFILYESPKGKIAELAFRRLNLLINLYYISQDVYEVIQSAISPGSVVPMPIALQQASEGISEYYERQELLIEPLIVRLKQLLISKKEKDALTGNLRTWLKG